MASSSSYIEHLLKNIEKKRQLSIKEFSKTDLNKSDDFEEVIFWYEEIINMVKLKPPNNYVRCLNIIESNSGHIESIQYDYCLSDALEGNMVETNFVIYSK
ncbi:MAG: hypothetical protein II297_05595 [Clostridia bacterium]|nr:hypothetical protein [Clostridia bacterium]